VQLVLKVFPRPVNREEMPPCIRSSRILQPIFKEEAVDQGQQLCLWVHFQGHQPPLRTQMHLQTSQELRPQIYQILSSAIRELKGTRKL